MTRNFFEAILLLMILLYSPPAKTELVIKENVILNVCKNHEITIKPIPPHDYGDRTKLSAFILCAMLGFTGAHHFYMKRYFSGALQISFFLASTILSILGTALFFSWLFLLALWAWVAADLLLIIFGGLRLKKGKKLIPFEQQL